MCDKNKIQNIWKSTCHNGFLISLFSAGGHCTFSKKYLKCISENFGVRFARWLKESNFCSHWGPKEQEREKWQSWANYKSVLSCNSHRERWGETAGNV